MERSVHTHTILAETPDIDQQWQVLKGAGHYSSGCFPCHGGPTLRRPRIALGMTPFPPDLIEAVPQWRPAELFYIVKHGVKFTGMPAWNTGSSASS